MAFKEITRRHTVVGLANKEAAEDLLGTVFTQDPIEIIGKGQGPAKTTTAVYGITAVEEFGINDELLIHWQIPELIDRTQKPTIHLEFAPTTAEAGKLLSLQINVAPNAVGSDISDTGTPFMVTDIAVPDTAFISFEVTLELPTILIEKDYDDLHIRIRRVTSSNDSAGDIALHHTSMEYQKHQR